MTFKDPNQSRQMVHASKGMRRATIDSDIANSPYIFRKVVIKLDTLRERGNGIKVSFPFVSVFVESATNGNSKVDLLPFTESDGNDSIELKLNGALNLDRVVSGCFILNDVQAGEQVTLIFLAQGSYRPGSLITEVASAVDGNSYSVSSPVAITTAPIMLAPQDFARTVLHIQASVPIEISGTAGGQFFPIDQTSKFKNTGEIWIKTLAGSGTVQIMEEK